MTHLTIDAMGPLADAHGRAARAAAVALEHRLDQHNLQGGLEGRITLGRHLANLTSSVGQLAALLTRLESEDAQDHPTVAEAREEAAYLASATFALMEELELRHGPVELGATGAELRRSVVTCRLIDTPWDDLVRLTSAGEAILAAAEEDATAARWHRQLGGVA